MSAGVDPLNAGKATTIGSLSRWIVSSRPGRRSGRFVPPVVAVRVDPFGCEAFGEAGAGVVALSRV